jgi:hypothetical protein
MTAAATIKKYLLKTATYQTSMQTTRKLATGGFAEAASGSVSGSLYPEDCVVTLEEGAAAVQE